MHQSILADRNADVTEPEYQVFVSHAGMDTWVAKQIQTQVTKCGPSTFLDEGDIYAGDDFENIILVELRRSTEILVLLTPWALKRPYVWLEIGAAWGLGKRLVFVLHGVTEADLSKRQSNPALLKRTNVVNINDLDKYFVQLTKRYCEKECAHD